MTKLLHFNLLHYMKFDCSVLSYFNTIELLSSNKARLVDCICMYG